LSSQRGGSNRLLVCLDAHLDRTLGSRAMDCTIVSHQKTAQVFRNRPTIFKGQTMESGADWETFNDAIGIRWASPDITFSNTMSLFWGGPEVILEHHPGPGSGSIWVNIPEEKIAFIGDAVQVNQPPFLSNADLEAWVESLDALQHNFRDYTLVSGRGGPVPFESVHTQQAYLKQIIQGLDKLVQANASPEMIEDLIPGLMKKLSFPAERREQYAQRLRTGLYQYYTRRFRPTNQPDSFHPEDEEN
jgi:glyoxylase-like metal-dependent hydrolase (beta-lactamase superfamily II)